VRSPQTRPCAVARGVSVLAQFHEREAHAVEPNSVAVATVDLDYKAMVEGRSQGPDNGTSPGSYWPARCTDLYGTGR